MVWVVKCDSGYVSAVELKKWLGLFFVSHYDQSQAHRFERADHAYEACDVYRLVHNSSARVVRLVPKKARARAMKASQ